MTTHRYVSLILKGILTLPFHQRETRATGADKEAKMLKYLHSNAFYDHANMGMEKS